MKKILKLSLLLIVIMTSVQIYAAGGDTLKVKNVTNKINVTEQSAKLSIKANSSSYAAVRYYYFPNLQAYFDTKRALYIYKENGIWVTAENIAPNYRGYSLRNSTNVMIKGYVGDEPYSLLEEHKVKYPANYSSRRQPPKAIASID